LRAVLAPGISRTLPAPLIAVPAAACAAAFGVAIAHQPLIAIALMGAAGLAVVALRFPVVTVGLILAITMIVPFGLQNRLAVGGGVGSPGLLLVDALAGLGLCRLAYRYARRAWPPSMLLAAALLVVFLVQAMHGVALGANASEAGTEARRLVLAAATALLTLPILQDEASRRRLYRILVPLGLALGLWGLAQWFGGLSYGAAGDVGVRSGVALTSGGRGQLQGGLFGFPVAVIFAFAALVGGQALKRNARVALLCVAALNLICVLLTYERTFWAATVLGCAFVLLRAPPARRAKALLWLPVFGSTFLVALIIAAPGELETAQERLLSVTQYRTDSSVYARVVESRFVVKEIHRHPLIGSGLGATITWEDLPNYQPETTPFSHNGYLWLAWKVGIPLAAFILLLLLIAIARPVRRRGLIGAICAGSQGGLLALLLINVTFPSVNALGITATTGAMVAACFLPHRRAGRGDRPASAPATI